MGQYHYPVNLDKKEFIHPWKLACGLKLWEQLATAPGVGAGLIILLASKSNGDGNGDLKLAPIVGRWTGDRIAFVGDYDDEIIYMVDGVEMTGAAIYNACGGEGWTDVSDQVCARIELELCGEFTGEGWRDWVPNE